MRTRILLLLLASLLALATVGAAAAGARRHRRAHAPRAFAPALGTYTGTQTSSYGSAPVTGHVSKSGRAILVQVLAAATMRCDDGSTAVGGVAIPARLGGRAFSATQTGRDSRYRTATWTLRGTFSGARAFSGTARKTADDLLADAGTTPHCDSGTIRFALRWSGR